METKTYLFGNEGSSTANLVSMLTPLLQQRGIDPSVLLAMRNNGGGEGSWFIWILFLLMFMRNGNGDVASQLDNGAGRDMLMSGIQGNANAISQLASSLGTSTSAIQQGINGLLTTVMQVGNSVGLTGQQTINAIQGGNASLAQQLCKCCCDNQLAVANQTSQLQQGIFGAQTALNDGITQNRFANQMGQSNLQHSIDMMGANDRLAICQQTDDLKTSATANTQAIIDKLGTLQTDMTREFCMARERDMQEKLDMQDSLITQLRGQISNDAQSKLFADAINVLQKQITELAAKQPNTVPVQYPQLMAVNATPQMGVFGGGNSFWN